MTAGPTFPDAFRLADYFLFDRLGEGLAEAPAVHFGAHTLSYAEVADRSRRAASAFARAGVRRGERVLVVLPDAPPFVWAIFGTLERGAVLAMGNPHAPAASIRKLVAYTRATALVTTPEVLEGLGDLADLDELLAIFVVPDVPTGGDWDAPVAASADARVVPLSAALAAADPGYRGPALHRDEPCIWLFTSGSTGEPKANVHTQRDFAFNTEVYAKGTVGYRRGDVTVSVPRLFFGYATGTNLFFPFAVGGSTGLFAERPTPESLADAIARYRPTVVTNVPTMIGKLLDHDEALRAAGAGGKGLDLTSVRFSLSAGEALPEPLLRRWLARTGSEIYDGIGSAEMFHIYATNRPGDVRPGTLGRVVDGYTLRILPEDAEGPGAPELPPGEIGVLWVRGDSASQGYWLDRDKSFATFLGPWCRTGDLFRKDADGYLVFEGRADDLLKVGGQWLAPREVEACLLEDPRVRLAAVVGVESEGLVKPWAFVVLARGEGAGGAGFAPDASALEEELRGHVRARLAPHKAPRRVVVRDALPLNDRGKIDRKALRAEAGT